MNRFLLVLSLFVLVSVHAFSQVTEEDYARADSVAKFGDYVYNQVNEVKWIENTELCWYKIKTRKGTEYKLVNPLKQKVTPLFNHEKLSAGLSKVLGKELEIYEPNLWRLHVSSDLKEISFEYDSKKINCSLKNYSCKITGEAEKRDYKHWGWTDGAYDSAPVFSPDSAYVAYVKNHNVFVKEQKSGKESQLSYDGSMGEIYSGHLSWSPDSKKLAGLKVRLNEKHYIHIIESSPKDQLEPKMIKREYLKPGDAMPIHKPCLFDILEMKQIEVDSQPFEHQFWLGRITWRPDSKAYTFEFNQRGHQVYQVVKVNADNGDCRVIINEQSDTFIDYSGKYFRHDIKDGEQIIWASERDGWNHLYLIDGNSGKVIQQITKGDWVIRGIEKVDEEKETIIFKAGGRNADEDPYFIHYCKVNFDGSGLVDLTPEKMNHDAVFSKDYKWMVDTYSKVDAPPVTVLRNASNGKVIMSLEKTDVSTLLAKGFTYPEVFVAKARDGKTDIWGNIYYPTNFDKNKSYPIIEYIYAGPHGAFTSKSFRAFNWAFSSLAELGFIVVQLDGMGTSYRSKAFQDVCYKNLKDAGFPDRIKWIKEAAETRPFMDTTRVGIFGGSAGGQESTAALLFQPQFYKAAVSSCGCHDNRMDKMWWNEQWMGFPIGKHYEECSNVVNAYRLKGELMLILGELDDNVDPSSTMQLVDALIKNNKEFELVVLPGVNHTLGGRYGERKRRDFFVKCFYKQLPPARNNN